MNDSIYSACDTLFAVADTLDFVSSSPKFDIKFVSFLRLASDLISTEAQLIWDAYSHIEPEPIEKNDFSMRV